MIIGERSTNSLALSGVGQVRKGEMIAPWQLPPGGLDTPSLLAVTDVDGVILVVERAGRAGRVRAARQQLDDVKALPIGVIVNRSEPDGRYDCSQRVPT